MRPPLIIFRHGQTEWNREGIHQGRLDSPLTAMGSQQAKGLAEILRPLVQAGDRHAYTSPTGMAKRSAELALGPLGFEAKMDDRLQEVHFGEWQGRTTAEIDEMSRVPKSADPFMWNFTSPEGETFEAMCARVQGFLDELTGPSIISTHGITSRVLRGLHLGLDENGMREMDGGQGCAYLLKDGLQQRFG